MTDNTIPITRAVTWLKRAQDATPDSGVSAWFSLIHGWHPSYIETTGYIINTFFACHERFSDPDLYDRAVKMADFLIELQLPSGGYRAYTPKQSSSDRVVVFNTGQDLLGMCEAYEKTKLEKFRESAYRAAKFLASIQEKNGSWISHTFGNKPHTYHTRVAWGMLWVAEITGDASIQKAAEKNLAWALQQQQKNGWFEQNELEHPTVRHPFTHTISYAIEGFLWSGLLLNRSELISAALKGATPLLNHFLENNRLPATFDSHWNSNDRYECLTGNAQISLMWLKLYQITGDRRFQRGGKLMNARLKNVQSKSIFSPINGSLPGSSPIWGDLGKNVGYCRLAYPNWGVKFYIDSLLEEEYARR